MGAIEHLTIPLPVEIADAMRARVADGEYASLSDLLEDALASLIASNDAVDDGPEVDAWVRREVLPAIDRYDADPSCGLTVDQVRERLAQARWARERPSC